MKSKKALKLTLAVLVALVLTLSLALVVSAGSDGAERDVAIIDMQVYRPYTFYPDGYLIGYESVGEKVDFSGDYIFIGGPSQDVHFVGNGGTPVTYNVVLHALDATAETWYGMFSVDYGVTVNFTVHGQTVIKGYNHPGIKIGEQFEQSQPPKVNITLADNSSLTIGYNITENIECVESGIELNIVGDGVTSSVDMSIEGWRSSRIIVFTKGNVSDDHNMVYTYVNDEVCLYDCEDCDVVGGIEKTHEIDQYVLEEADESYATKHRVICYRCDHEFDSEEHDIKYTVSEEHHVAECSECLYESDKEEHTYGDNGCTVCGAEYVVSYTRGDVTVKKLILKSILADVAADGGEITLLGDVDSSYEVYEIKSTDADVVIDLAGKALKSSRIIAGVGTTIKVIDSSTEKSGKFHGYYRRYSGVQGALRLEGIALSDFYVYVYSDADLTLEDCTLDGDIVIESDPGKVTITNTRSAGNFTVNIEESFVAGDHTIFSGSFAALAVQSLIGERLRADDLLPEGYAFFGEDGIIDGSASAIKGVTGIYAHTDHNSDIYHSDGAEHWKACTCGKNESTERAPHSLGTDGKCETCSNTVEAELTMGGTVKYFTDINLAFDAVVKGSEGTVKLISDSDFYNTRIVGRVILDLNGYELTLEYDRMFVEGELIINDTSASKTGSFMSHDDIGYIIELQKTGTLVINGGKYFGLIHSDYGPTAERVIEINGGRFIGKEKFRLTENTKITVNGGVFECSHSVFDTTWSKQVVYIINGGTFIDSTVFELYEPDSELLRHLGSGVGECELAFIGNGGRQLTGEDVSNFYGGEIVVAHKNAVLTKDAEHHWLVCTCGAETAKISHTETYSLSKSDALVHDVICRSCEYFIGAVSHTGGTATCTYRARCEWCNAPYGSTLDHVYDNNCDAVCNVCTDARTVPDHVYDNACDGECNECQEARTASDHVYDNACDKTCNVCSDPRTASDHVYDNACDDTCNVCSDTRTVANHTYVDEKCTECGASQDAPDKMGTGARILICLGALVAFGALGYALYRIMIKKKLS